MAHHYSCTKVRTRLVTKVLLDINTGKTRAGESHWETGPCDTPLFGKQAALGLCRSCERGWTHPNNYPADEGRPEKEHTGLD